MNTRKTYKLSLGNSMLDTAEEGRALAVRLLEKIEHYELETEENEGEWPWSMFARYRPIDTPQDNLVLRCIEALQKKGTPEALAGFCAVLTDYLGQENCAGGAYHTKVYKNAEDRDLNGFPGPWPKLFDDNDQGASNG